VKNSDAFCSSFFLSQTPTFLIYPFHGSSGPSSSTSDLAPFSCWLCERIPSLGVCVFSIFQRRFYDVNFSFLFSSPCIFGQAPHWSTPVPSCSFLLSFLSFFSLLTGPRAFTFDDLSRDCSRILPLFLVVVYHLSLWRRLQRALGSLRPFSPTLPFPFSPRRIGSSAKGKLLSC